MRSRMSMSMIKNELQQNRGDPFLQSLRMSPKRHQERTARNQRNDVWIHSAARTATERKSKSKHTACDMIIEDARTARELRTHERRTYVRGIQMSNTIHALPFIFSAQKLNALCESKGPRYLWNSRVVVKRVNNNIFFTNLVSPLPYIKLQNCLKCCWDRL